MASEQSTVDPASLLDGLDVDIPVPGPGQASATVTGEVPQFFGPYQLIQQVGRGGVARVLRARHIHPRYGDVSFAVKILHPELSSDPQVVALFRHEAYVLSLLKHPNIIQTFEAGSQDGELFIAMEYVDGRDLDNMLVRSQRTKSPLPIPVALHIIGEILKALAYAHELTDADGNSLHLIHRDVTPANVFISYDGRVKLADFGVASIAAAGRQHRGGNLTELVGKPGYFAPEQLAGEPVDQRADLFSLGVMMFEMLTGAKLFAGDTADDMLRSNKRAKIPRPSSLNADIPPPLEAVLLKALEKRPDGRYASAREMLRALNGFVPPPVGMSLAVAALMRKVFLTEHIQELQLREGLTGVAMSRGSGQCVAVCSTDERAQAAFNELLSSRGYRPTVCPTLEHVSAALATPTPPALVLADVCSRGFSPAQFVVALAKGHQSVPVVAVSDGLSAQWIHFADAIGAVDLLFKPFNIERVLTAVRAAISGAARVADIETSDVLRIIGIRPHLLVVSRDAELALRLTRGFSEKGFEVEVVPSAGEALDRTDAASYHLVVYDAPQPTPNDRVFAAQYRSRPAMGLVPVIFLTSPEALTVFAGVESDRGAVRPRTEAPLALADLGRALLADNRLGRVFVRYAINLPVELRYGGRVFNCQSIDVSRGGMMLRSDQMPPVGTEVGVALKLPGVPVPVEVSGRVTRVDLPTGGTERRAGLGVEFERFAAGSEPDLIGFLRTLDPAALAKRTVILGGQP